MKKIPIVLSALILASCVNFNFDPVEYDGFVRISEISTNAIYSCGTESIIPNIKLLKTTVDHQVLYTKNRTSRVKIADSTQELSNIVDGIYNRYNQNILPSKFYCEEKLKHITEANQIILNIEGKLQ